MMTAGLTGSGFPVTVVGLAARCSRRILMCPKHLLRIVLEILTSHSTSLFSSFRRLDGSTCLL